MKGGDKFLSFLLNGDKMRQRLAQILEQAEEKEIHDHHEGEVRNDRGISHSGTFE
jgi:hypothetical protein